MGNPWRTIRHAAAQVAVGDMVLINPGTDENGFGGGSTINMDGVTDTAVRNKLLYDNHASGISLYQIDGGSGSRDNWVLNNSIIVAADSRWAINIPDLGGTGNKLYNNIILTYTVGGGAF